jgi:hypothetical protein
LGADQGRKPELLQNLNRISLESVEIYAARFLVSVFFCASAAFAVADDDFKSKILQANDRLSITVPVDHFLKIRNFTQEGGNQRGLVTVTTTSNGLTANVLTAAIIDPMAAAGSLEVINSVVIEGPANVTVTCGNADASCFVSYRKDSD